MNLKQVNPATESETKQPYEKPAILYQAPLEAMASDCWAWLGIGDPIPSPNIFIYSGAACLTITPMVDTPVFGVP